MTSDALFKRYEQDDRFADLVDSFGSLIAVHNSYATIKEAMLLAYVKKTQSIHEPHVAEELFLMAQDIVAMGMTRYSKAVGVENNIKPIDQASYGIDIQKVSYPIDEDVWKWINGLSWQKKMDPQLMINYLLRFQLEHYKVEGEHSSKELMESVLDRLSKLHALPAES